MIGSRITYEGMQNFEQVKLAAGITPIDLSMIGRSIGPIQPGVPYEPIVLSANIPQPTALERTLNYASSAKDAADEAVENFLARSPRALGAAQYIIENMNDPIPPQTPLGAITGALSGGVIGAIKANPSSLFSRFRPTSDDSNEFAKHAEFWKIAAEITQYG